MNKNRCAQFNDANEKGARLTRLQREPELLCNPHQREQGWKSSSPS